jgi:hypothetical protein
MNYVFSTLFTYVYYVIKIRNTHDYFYRKGNQNKFIGL